MKNFKRTISTMLALAASAAASAHTGHGTPGTLAHDMQHQFWLFGALVVVGAILVFLQSRLRDRD